MSRNDLKTGKKHHFSLVNKNQTVRRRTKTQNINYLNS